MHITAQDEQILSNLLWQLKQDFSIFLDLPGGHMDAEEASLARMKRSALDFYKAIQTLCAQGKTVVLHSGRHKGAKHIVRALGPLNPDGITTSYSSEPGVKVYRSRCALLSVDWVAVHQDGSDTSSLLSLRHKGGLQWV